MPPNNAVCWKEETICFSLWSKPQCWEIQIIVGPHIPTPDVQSFGKHPNLKEFYSITLSVKLFMQKMGFKTYYFLLVNKLRECNKIL